ncbi:MAG TPA: hypothetical protein VK547_09690 [Candidatus Udaeobacter sp.]|nr:hypothetical protein [Candidatus Udaeobacter sp.]
MKQAAATDGREGAPRCRARLRQGEGRCRKSTGWGTPHVGTGRCRLHGGSTGTQIVGVERRQVEDGARRILADLGAAAPVENPLVELQLLAGEILAFRNALRSMVERLDGVRYSGEAGESIRGEVILYERALDRCTRVLTDIAKLNLDERLVAITEKQGTAIATALRAALQAAGIRPGSGEDRAAKAALVAGLRSVGRGGGSAAKARR